MNELNQLKLSLENIFRISLKGVSFENVEARKKLRETIEIMGVISPLQSSTVKITQAVAEYRQTMRLDTFQAKKYVCYGAATPMQDGWCVLSDDVLRENLLNMAKNQIEFRQRIKFFEWLLGAYFTFSNFAFEKYNNKFKDAQSGWEKLRDWLEIQRKQIEKQFERDRRLRQPDWFAALTKHKNLLDNKPCDRYGADMLRGDYSSIEEAKKYLGIQHNSWVMEEAILSHMRAAAALIDPSFKSKLESLLKRVMEKTDSLLIKRRAIAILISRYAKCTERQEHRKLCDAAVEIIGNPMSENSWNAWVILPDGSPDKEARNMVNGWRTRRLLKLFFNVLSADGKAVQRRLDYWLKYESKISGLWFVVGSNAQYKAKHDPEYRGIQELAGKSSWIPMSNEMDKDNNAFVMRIGEKLVIEFGLKNNACFFYATEPMPFMLDEQGISEHLLKIHNRTGIGKKFPHQGNWEDTFDQAIFPEVGYHPSVAISQTAQPDSHNFPYIERYVKGFSLRTEDNRPGGAFWVLTTKGKYPEVDQNLESWGFKFKENRGWWKQ